MKALTLLARRFVAGETKEAAIQAGLRLQERGIRATFDLLGEDVLDRAAAKRCAEANQALLRALPPDVERNISIKLSMMGLDIAEDYCLELTSGILEVAREMKGFVRLDMEGSKHTQRTIDAFQKLRKTFDNVGIVLQAYLHRTLDDVKEATSRGDRVRICKGAYKEPASIAWTHMDEIRANYRKCAHLLLENGNYPAIATHDESLVTDVIEFTRGKAIPSERFEFQMLYGLRPKRWEELVGAGYRVRVYVPYGTHWFPYFYRRLRERKENVFFVLRSLFGG
ncbi:MAG TPA: proline dehydrogenase family protein [Vicinamibacteria bacterium]|jgi:proline dehydrogenase|nr:proline dehydrogenase family protein [Vicinamibacteria bacterium]